MTQTPSIPRWVIALAIVLATCGAWRQAFDKDKADKVKSAYVLNFIKYTEWPADAFENDESPIVITVLGNDCLQTVLEDVMAAADPIGARKIAVRRIKRPQASSDGAINADALADFEKQLRKSHVLYFCDSERLRLRSILNALNGANVLTVSDMADFASNGGMLGLALQDTRIVFDANTDAIQKTSLTVSSKVLKLARIIRSEKP